ncbi:MAG TPA: hypothetical protein VMH26_18170, partial [Burkholderiales bacterium]|nr:hypothetical protein [Burkholderiales bacterium]
EPTHFRTSHGGSTLNCGPIVMSAAAVRIVDQDRRDAGPFEAIGPAKELPSPLVSHRTSPRQSQLQLSCNHICPVLRYW